MKTSVYFENIQYFLAMYLKEKTRTKITQTIFIPREAAITSQQYNMNLLDMSVSEEIIC